MIIFISIVTIVAILIAWGIRSIVVSVREENKKIEAMPPMERYRYIQKRENEQAKAVENRAQWIADMETKSAEQKAKSDEQSKTYKWGDLSAKMICPHCQSQGMVRAKSVKNKKGISGAKATGAILTGGVSILATGLSRKESATQAHCDNCDSTWTF